MSHNPAVSTNANTLQQNGLKVGDRRGCAPDLANSGPCLPAIPSVQIDLARPLDEQALLPTSSCLPAIRYG